MDGWGIQLAGWLVGIGVDRLVGRLQLVSRLVPSLVPNHPDAGGVIQYYKCRKKLFLEFPIRLLYLYRRTSPVLAAIGLVWLRLTELRMRIIRYRRLMRSNRCHPTGSGFTVPGRYYRIISSYRVFCQACCVLMAYGLYLIEIPRPPILLKIT